MKILRKVSMQIQSGNSYEYNNMSLMSFSDGKLLQSFSPIDDDGIKGNGFTLTPLQGSRSVSGSYSFNADVNTLPVLLEAALGSTSTIGSHLKKLSIAELNGITCDEYTSCYIKSMKISGSKGGLLKVDIEIFSTGSQYRSSPDVFPTPVTIYDSPLPFSSIGGSGYFYIGDQVNALGNSDRISIESFEINIITGFDESFANTVGSLDPQWGMITPKVSVSFKIPRHYTEQYQTWHDNNTPLQLEIYSYVSSSKNIKFQFPNITIKSGLLSADQTTISIEAYAARNGRGVTYTNSNMAFISPMKISMYTPPAQTLVGWWRGENNALDSSGNNLNGVWSGTPRYHAGFSGDAFNFASDGEVRIAYNPLFDTFNNPSGKFKCECYFKFTTDFCESNITGVHLITFFGGTWPNLINWSIKFNRHRNLELFIYFDGEGYYSVGIYDYILPNIQHYLEVFYNNGVWSVYVDSILLYENYDPFNVLTTTPILLLGSYATEDYYSNNDFYLDEIKIYSQT